MKNSHHKRTTPPTTAPVREVPVEAVLDGGTASPRPRTDSGNGNTPKPSTSQPNGSGTAGAATVEMDPDPLATLFQQRKREMAQAKGPGEGTAAPLATLVKIYSPDKPRAASPNPEKSAAAEARRLAEAERAAADAAIVATGVEKHYRNATLDRPAPKSLTNPEHAAGYLAVAKRLGILSKDWGIMALIGPRGPGKTALACGMLLDATRREKKCMGKYFRLMDLFIDLGDAMDGGDKDRRTRRVLESYVKPHILVFDECQEQPEKPWHSSMLSYIADRRHAEEKITVFLSNDTLETFKKAVGLSIQSRIQHRGRIIECLWPSLREPDPVGTAG